MTACCFIAGISVVHAQDVQVNLEGTFPDSYFTHQVQKGQTLSAIGRLYSTSVGDIMRLNGMHADSKLSVNDNIKIPVNATNLSQQPSPLALTHRVAKGETLYRISVNHNKVPVAKIKEWNHLQGDALSLDQPVIIGYVKTGGPIDAAAIRQDNNNSTTIQYPTGQATTQPVKHPEEPARSPEPKPVTVTDNSQSTNRTFDPPPATTPADNTGTPANTQVTPATRPATTPAATTTTTAPAKTASAPVNAAPIPTPTTEVIDPSKIKPEGYFTSLYGQNVEGRDAKTIEGSSMVFKTASGWADKKYYILMNEAPPGSIVQIKGNGKTIYAKVLWKMEDMKENEGIRFRISNAAASALGMSDEKFPLTIAYFE